MYEIQLIQEDRERYLPLLAIASIPADGALYVMREHEKTQCAALVLFSPDGCTLAAFGRSPDAAEGNEAVLLEWVYFKCAQQFSVLQAALPPSFDAFLAAHGFTAGADGRWTRALSAGCQCGRE